MLTTLQTQLKRWRWRREIKRVIRHVKADGWTGVECAKCQTQGRILAIGVSWYCLHCGHINETKRGIESTKGKSQHGIL